MDTVRVPRARGLVLENVDWRTYSRLLRAFQGHSAVRLTYDRGRLEMMMVSFEHEGGAYLLGRFIDVLTEELRMPIAAGRTTTMRRKSKERGLEPDNCYWFEHAAQVRGKKKIDLRSDPPPDLAMEMEVSRRALKRLGIYAALGVPEVWRFDGQALKFHVLKSKGGYAVAFHSRSFPGLKPADLLSFLNQVGRVDENDIIRQFREWVKQAIGCAVLTAPKW